MAGRLSVRCRLSGVNKYHFEEIVVGSKIVGSMKRPFYGCVVLFFILMFLTTCWPEDPEPERVVLVNWHPTNGPPGGSILSLGWSDGSLFVGTDNGLLMSQDEGNTWTLVNDDPESYDVKAVTSAGNTQPIHSYR